MGKQVCGGGGEVSRSRLGTVRSATGGAKSGDGRQRFDVGELGDEAISDAMCDVADLELMNSHSSCVVDSEIETRGQQALLPREGEPLPDLLGSSGNCTPRRWHCRDECPLSGLQSGGCHDFPSGVNSQACLQLRGNQEGTLHAQCVMAMSAEAHSQMALSVRCLTFSWRMAESRPGSTERRAGY